MGGATAMALAAAAVDIINSRGAQYEICLLLCFSNELVTQQGTNISDVAWSEARTALRASLQLFMDALRRVGALQHALVYGGPGEIWGVPNASMFRSRVNEVIQIASSIGIRTINGATWMDGQLTAADWNGFHL